MGGRSFGVRQSSESIGRAIRANRSISLRTLWQFRTPALAAGNGRRRPDKNARKISTARARGRRRL
jgi:hypothetical protein